MALSALFSERNVLNSVARHLADALLAANYLVYWHEQDAVETPAGWYPNYYATQATYATDPAFQAALTTARALVTLCDGETAFPRLLARPTADGGVGAETQVQPPVIGLSVGPDILLRPYEAGSHLKWRARAVLLEGRTRTKPELQALADALGEWFLEDQRLAVEDHDGTSGEAAELARIDRRSIVRAVDAEAGPQDRYQVECQVRLEYVA